MCVTNGLRIVDHDNYSTITQKLLCIAWTQEHRKKQRYKKTRSQRGEAPPSTNAGPARWTKTRH